MQCQSKMAGLLAQKNSSPERLAEVQCFSMIFQFEYKSHEDCYLTLGSRTSFENAASIL